MRLLDALSATGLKEIAIGSFVSPKYTPQMAIMDELVARFTPVPGVRYVYTALNDRGRERAAAYTPPLSRKVLEYATRVDMCDVFAQRNTNRSIAQQVAAWPQTIENALAKGATEGCMSISNAFGSNWSGEVTVEQLMHMFDRMHNQWAAAGIEVTKIGLSDAMGWNMPQHAWRRAGVGLRRDSHDGWQRYPASAKRHRRHGGLPVLRQWPRGRHDRH